MHTRQRPTSLTQQLSNIWRASHDNSLRNPKTALYATLLSTILRGGEATDLHVRMSYKVCKVESLGNGERNHIAIYIETDPSAPQDSIQGRLYHVTGTILNGMKYDPRETVDPERLPEHIPGSKEQIATIAREDLARFESDCCLAVPPPKSQVTLSGKRLYPGEPLYRCGDWLRDVEKVAVGKGIFQR